MLLQNNHSKPSFLLSLSVIFSRNVAVVESSHETEDENPALISSSSFDRSTHSTVNTALSLPRQESPHHTEVKDTSDKVSPLEVNAEIHILSER